MRIPTKKQLQENLMQSRLEIAQQVAQELGINVASLTTVKQIVDTIMASASTPTNIYNALRNASAAFMGTQRIKL